MRGCEGALSKARQMARLIVVLFLLPTLVACGRSAERAEPASGGAHLVERSRGSMGAEAHLTAWTSDDSAATAAFEAVFDEFERLESLMSVWREGSDIVRLNAAAGRASVVVSPDVMEALRVAREVGDWTNGAFDVTFGALSDVWKFDHDQDNRIPSSDEIRRRLPLVDYRALELDVAARTAYLTRTGMRAHLGGIGKGFAVDRAAGILRSRGIGSFMIQFGGDLYVAGARGDRPWRLGIRDPRGPADASFAAIDLTDAVVQHLRRLRTVLSSPGQALSPHPRSADRRANPGLPKRDDRGRDRHTRRRAVDRRLRARSRRRHGADRAPPEGRRCHRDRQEPRARLVRPEGPTRDASRADRCQVNNEVFRSLQHAGSCRR